MRGRALVAHNIYIGPMPNNFEMKALKESGITAILSIMRPEEGADAIARNARGQGMAWSAVPIRDAVFSGVPEPEHIKQAVDILDCWVRKGHVVYVHCMMAQGRSPLIVIAYRCLIKGEDLMAAIHEVKQAWPDANCSPKQIEVLCRILNKR